MQPKSWRDSTASVNLAPPMRAPAELADLSSVEAKPEPVSRRTFSLPFPKIWLALVCTILALIVGYLDYLTGYEQSLLLFYLVPIAIATWFGRVIFGLTFSIFCVAVWVLSD